MGLLALKGSQNIAQGKGTLRPQPWVWVVLDFTSSPAIVYRDFPLTAAQSFYMELTQTGKAIWVE